MKKLLSIVGIVLVTSTLSFSGTYFDGFIDNNLANWSRYNAVHDILPGSSNTLSLGSFEYPFEGIYLGTNAIYMEGYKVFSITSNGMLQVGLTLVTTGGTFATVSFPTNTWSNGWYLTSYDGGTTTCVKAQDVFVEVDPIWSSESNLYYLASNPNGFLSVETDPIATNLANVIALSAAHQSSNNVFTATNDFSQGTVYIQDGTATNSPLTRTQIYDLFEGLSEVTLYGATNKHPVITDAASMWREVPSIWAITNTGASGSNLLGTFWYTNTQNLIREGNYIGRLWATESGAGSSEIVIELVYTADNGVTTNLIARSTSSGTVGGTLASYRLTCAIETNVEFATTPAYLGVKCYQVRGAQASTIVIYGGTNYETHLETPGLGSVNGYVLNSTFNTYTGAVADVISGSISNWSYCPAKSNVDMAGLAITNITTASMETNVVDVIYRKNGYKLMDSSALYWDNPLTGWSVVFDSGALVSPSSGTSLDWQKYHLTNGEWKVSNAANEGHEIVNWNVLTGTKISSSTNSDTANVASNLTETATNSLMTLASNSFAHGSLTMGYLVSSNNTNEIVWFGDFQRPLTITNLGWFSTVGSATGIVFLADNATAPSAWDSICYTGLAFAAQVRSNDAVSISVTAGQRIGFMASECTNATLFVGW